MALAVALKSIDGRTEGLVFPAPGGKKYCRTLCSFVRVVDDLGLRVGNNRLHFHDLRHVYDSWLADAGVSMGLIRLLMGHRSKSTTDRYVTMRTGAIVGLSTDNPQRQMKDPCLSLNPSVKGDRDWHDSLDESTVGVIRFPGRRGYYLLEKIMSFYIFETEW